MKDQGVLITKLPYIPHIKIGMHIKFSLSYCWDVWDALYIALGLQVRYIF